MPNAPKRFNPISQEQKKQIAKERDAVRGSAQERGYGARWAKHSEWFLSQPECVFCACGCGRVAECTDHIEKRDPRSREFITEITNHQPLTIACNNRKSREIDHAPKALTSEQHGLVARMKRLAWYRADAITKRLTGMTAKKVDNRFVVCGKQGAGKTTWVSQHAKPGDIIWDMDSVYLALGFGRDKRPPELIQPLLGMRQLIEAHLEQTDGGACLIVSDEDEAHMVANRIGASVVCVVVSEAERARRISVRSYGDEGRV